MDTKTSIQQLVNGVLDELKAQGYSPGTIKGYDAGYMDLLAYADDNGIHEYTSWERDGELMNWLQNLRR